jgi:hypothetical protein
MNELETMKTRIEKMDKKHHIEILKIIKEKNKSLVVNENKNGTWINMFYLSEITIEELKKYIYYIDEQEKSFNQIENEKDNLMKTYFTEEDNVH